MPKEPAIRVKPPTAITKPAPVSAPTLKSIERLHVQIAAAEKFLRKLPGSRHVDTRVSLNDIFPIHPEDNNDFGSTLEYCGNGEESGICVCFQYLNTSNGEVETSHKRIDSFPTITRIALARRIPELIQLSREAEGKVAMEADEAADSIEQAIAELGG